jgi:hypothetical protein
VRELQTGLWHWQAPHPQWRPTEPWSENVSSYAIDDGERLLLFDPLAVPSELEDVAARRETAIVLTAPWHERDAERLVERLGVPVYTPLPDTAQFLMDTYGNGRAGRRRQSRRRLAAPGEERRGTPVLVRRPAAGRCRRVPRA